MDSGENWSEKTREAIRVSSVRERLRERECLRAAVEEK